MRPRRRHMSEKKTYPIAVVRWQGKPHCIYLNDYRIAGGKPWGGGDTLAEWRVSLKDLLSAVPDLDQALVAARLEGAKEAEEHLRKAVEPLISASEAEYTSEATSDEPDDSKVSYPEDACRAEAAEARIAALEAERDGLREALEIIAGERQCLDNLMSNVEVARAALSGPETGAAA